MPGKHVRFADAFPATPSPSYSASSLPSTAGPFTPQSSAYTTLCPTYDGPYTIHPLLKFSSDPSLNYDISLPASSIKPRDPNLPQYVLAQPATEPPLPYLEVISPQIPWRIAIHPSNQGVPVPTVTVSDVLFGVYTTLRLPVSSAEYGLIPSEQIRTQVDDSFRHRCKRLTDPRAVDTEFKKGIKRIDFLTEKHIFLGLTSTKRGGHVWQLNTSR